MDQIRKSYIRFNRQRVRRFHSKERAAFAGIKHRLKQRARFAGLSRSDGWKLASYEVAGDAPAMFVRPEGTMDFRRPFRTDFFGR
jgi:hypothetical protein